MSHVECQDCGYIGRPYTGEKGILYCRECDSFRLTQCEVDMNSWITTTIPRDETLRQIAETYRDVWEQIKK